MSEMGKTNPASQKVPAKPAPGSGAELYRVSLDLLPEASLLFSPNGVILQANDAVRLQFEADSLDEILGKNIYDFGMPSEELRRQAFDRILAGKSIRFEMEFKTLKGRYRIFDIMDIPLRSPAGEIETVLGFAHDITEQRRAEAERDQLVAVLEASDDAIMSFAPDLRILSWNRGAERMLGFSRAEMIGKAVDIVLAPESRPIARKMMAQDIERMSKDPSFVRRMEFPLRRKDGGVVEAWIVASGVFDPAGKLIGVSAIHRDITERKQAERERAMLATMVESSDDAILAISPDLRVMSWNRGAGRLLGYSRDEIIGESVDLLLPPDSRHISRQMMLEDIERMSKDPSIVRRAEVQILGKDDRLIDTSLVASGLFDSTGRLIGLAASHRDITESKRAERERASLAAIVNASDDAIIRVTKELDIVTMNPAAERLLDCTAQEAVAGGFKLLLPPEELGPALEAARTMIETGQPVTPEVRSRHKDGTWVTLQVNMFPVRDSAGNIVAGAGIGRDITESERTEREHATLAAIVNASDDAIIGFSKDLKMTTWNPGAERTYGYTAEEAIGQSFDLFVPAEQLPQALEADRKMFETGQPVTFEEYAQRKGGTWFTSLVNIFPVRDSAGNIVAGAGIGRDITNLKRAQEELRTAHEYTRGLIDSAIDAMVAMDAEMRITDMNEELARMTEVPRKTLIGSRFDSYFSDPERAAQIFARTLEEGFVAGVDLTMRAASGKEVEVSFNASIFHSDGKVLGIFAVARDVTEQRAADRTLREEREYSRSLVESSPDALLVCDTNLVLTDINEQAVQLTGFGRAKLIGVKLPALFAEYNRVLELGLQTPDHGPVRDVELTLVAKSAERIPVSLNASVFRNASGATRGMLVALRDVTERKRSESERMLLASIVATTGDAIFTESPELIITSWNAAAEKLFGYSAAEAIGRDAALLVPLERRGELAAHIRAFQEGARFERIETARLRKDGTPVEVALTASPINDSAGRLTAISITAHDISARRQIEAELTKARDVALEASRLKSEFLANMSHEIRTPLNSIIGMTGLLLDTPLSSEQHEYANDVRESGETLLNLINEILDFSKIAAGKMIFENINFELRGAVEGAVEMVAEQARRKKLELTVSIDPDTPHLLRGDPARLRQVLLNLLANAIKFTERGEVAVAVSKLTENPHETLLRFEVRDSGIGIPENKRHLLFLPFSQVDSSTSRHFGGTGLGLSIAREIVGAMGGTISVNSTEGVGSTFWFTAKFAKQVNTSVTAAELLASLAGVRAIVVDDNGNSRKILSHELSSWGMEVKTAESAFRALELMRAAAPSNPFAVAIIDVMMPEMDGVELARMIAGDPALRSTKVVLVSSAGARSEFNTRLRGLPIGGWLIKPVPQSSLYDAVLKVVPVPPAGLTLASQHAGAEPAQAQTQAIPAAARRKLKVLIAEDNPINMKLAKRQLLKLGIEADCATDGNEAVAAVALRPYDLVLMDCQMPEMDGYEATAEIRRSEGGGRHTKIIAMTAHALQGDRERCIAAGMDGYLSKPVDLNVLEKELNEIAAASRGSADTPEQAAAQTSASAAATDRSGAHPPEQSVAAGALQPAPPPATKAQTPDGVGDGSLDANAIADLRAEGNGLLDDLIAMFLEQLPMALTALAEAVAGKDSQAIAFHAHRLKGAVSNFGALAMTELCQSLETAAKAGDFIGAAYIFDRLKTVAERVRQALEQERTAPPGTNVA
jgi:two-component system, sensor histidine kinase and response regulator